METFFGDLISVIFTEQFLTALAFIARWAPLWLPILLLYGFWNVWVHYVRAKFISGMEWTFLEVRLPQEISKSPAAMELFLGTLLQGFGEDNMVMKYWQGSVRPWTSLELVSIEGSVHFIFRIFGESTSLFESQLYSQYPDAEITKTTDYTDGVDLSADDIQMWGGEFILSKPDPYPIKTYIDYGLDRDPKEEYKIDPMTPMIEWLGSLGKNEQAWVQVIVRKHDKEDKNKGAIMKGGYGIFGKKGFFGKDGPLRGKVDNWKEDVKKEIEKIVGDRKIKRGDEEDNTPIKLTKVEEETITALERSITKDAFDTVIRGIYFAKGDVFNGVNIGGLIGSWRHFSSAGHLNGFKPNAKYKTGFDAPFRQDPFGRRVPKRKRIIVDAYKRRCAFHPPHKRKHFVLNTEELATIYHFPGQVATTPTFKRIDSRKTGPPVNLPRA